MSSTFILSLRNITPIVLGQWLTLDAILDGILEQDGIEAEQRVLPLLSWDGTAKQAGLNTAQVREYGLVPMASAMRVKGPTIKVGEDLSFQATRPAVTTITLRGGHNPRMLPDGQFPFTADSGREANRYQMAREASALWLDTRQCLSPCQVEWLAQGDPEAVVKLISRAPGIGAKITSGMGRYEPSSVNFHVLHDAHPLSGLLDEDGAFVHRPIPQELAPPDARSRLSHQTCRSPYWVRTLSEPAVVPLARHYDGLLTI